jgi:copper chaperone CopZ
MEVSTKVGDPVGGMTIDLSSRAAEKEESTAAAIAAFSDGKNSEPLHNAEVLSGRRSDYSTSDGAGEPVDLPIIGMTCAACANRIEKQLSKLAGVEKASVNFAAARATVSYNPEKTGVGNLIQTVKDAGYDTAGTSTVEFR